MYPKTPSNISSSSPNQWMMNKEDISSDLFTSLETLDPYIKEKLLHTANSSEKWCCSHEKNLNIGWIAGIENILFFQYLSHLNVNKYLLEYPIGYSIEKSENVKLIKRDHLTFVACFYSNFFTFDQIFNNKKNPSHTIRLNFIKEDEIIANISNHLESDLRIWISIITNQNRIYILTIDLIFRGENFDIQTNIQVIEKRIKLIQQLKMFFIPDWEKQHHESFVKIRREKTLTIVSYSKGKLDFFALVQNPNRQVGPLAISNVHQFNHEWSIDLYQEIIDKGHKDNEISTIPGNRDLSIIDMVIRKTGIKLECLIMGRLYIKNKGSATKGFHILYKIEINEKSGLIINIINLTLNTFELPEMNTIAKWEEIINGRVIHKLGDDIFLALRHIINKTKHAKHDLTDPLAFNYFFEVNFNIQKIFSTSLDPKKLLGAGKLSEKQGEESIILFTDRAIIKMKTLIRSIEESSEASLKKSLVKSISKSYVFDKTVNQSPALQNKFTNKFKELLTNFKLNPESVKEDIDHLFKTYIPLDISEAIISLTNQFLKEKNRNLILASTNFSQSKNDSQSSRRIEYNSELITNELQKKIIKINKWIEFLEYFNPKYHIWAGPYGDIRIIVETAKEKILAAIRLRELQKLLSRLADDDNLLADFINKSIITCLDSWGLKDNIENEYINHDIFYTHCEKFDEFLMNLGALSSQYYENTMNSGSLIHSLNKLWIDIFNSIFDERNKLKDYQNSTPYWTQNKKLLELIDKQCKQTYKSYASVGFEDDDLKEDLYSLTKILVSEYNALERLKNSNTGIGDGMIIEKNELYLGSLEYNPMQYNLYHYNYLIDSKMYKEAGQLAYEFRHENIICDLYCKYDYNYQLNNLFSQWNSPTRSFLREFVSYYMKWESDQTNNRAFEQRGFRLFLDFEKHKEMILQIIYDSYPNLVWIYRLHLGYLDSLTLSDIVQAIQNENKINNQLTETAFGNLLARIIGETEYGPEFPTKSFESIYNLNSLQRTSLPNENNIKPMEVIIKVMSTNGKDLYSRIKVSIGYIRDMINLHNTSKIYTFEDANQAFEFVVKSWIDEEHIQASIMEQEHLIDNSTPEQLNENLNHFMDIIERYIHLNNRK